MMTPSRSIAWNTASASCFRSMQIAYRVDPDAVAKWLPEPVELGDHPDVAYVAFSKWWSVWEDVSVPFISLSPWEATTPVSFAPGPIAAKKLGQVSITDLNPYNPGMPAMGPGAKLTGVVASHYTGSAPDPSRPCPCRPPTRTTTC